jgi:tetratricopeptide (TPR) repeat protein
MDLNWERVSEVCLIGTVIGLLVWGLLMWLRRSAEPGKLVVKWLISAGLIAIVFFVLRPLLAGEGLFAAIVAITILLAVAGVGALIWAPSLSETVGGFFGQLYDDGDRQPELRALYSIAEAKRKHGDYHEAIAEVRAQLDKFPHDFDGWMMLAEIQAENLHDLPAATESVERIATQPGIPPGKVAFAFHRLADWRWRLGRDPEAVRLAFARIIELFPDSAEAHLAQQRLAHVAGAEMLPGAQTQAPLALPQGDERLGLREDTAHLRRKELDPAAHATELVRQLERFPSDNQAREELAAVYAFELHRVDLAVDQLEQLLAQPYVTISRAARWLNLLADIQVKEADDCAAAQQTLERLIALEPEGAAAELARQRLRTLGLEARGKQKSQAIKLGSREQELRPDQQR